ncbi:uncharacterized protein LOC131163381 [Malania oleifera]|uniref:uncharacterized protein LOC131163381 n=1 Tax=Malania oleifera TaxID=397392 RepID=UPI0025AEC45F|nr:uncharacterized protein LOC131163381 [Malania oleifera]
MTINMQQQQGPSSETHTTTINTIPLKPYSSKHQPITSYFSTKLSLYLLATCATLVILSQIHSLHTTCSPPSLLFPNCSVELAAFTAKLRLAVTFLPLKDLRYAKIPLRGHTWFMSSMLDTHADGEVQYQHFPSAASGGSLLCLRGRHTHDGTLNSYALAWPEALPHNAILMEGLTFVSYNHYDYHNIWHGLSAAVPFVAWHLRNRRCSTGGPTRWVLYHRGEMRTAMGPWLSHLMAAAFDCSTVNIEGFEEVGDEGVVCFEEAVVMRHNEGGMSRERRMEVYDFLRCKARAYCNISEGASEGGGDGRRRGVGGIGMTVLLRTGARSFRNESAVVGIFERECSRVEGCRLVVAYSNNQSFCEQVKMMRMTDILVSPHGAQLTNMFLMDRNSSVMEFFPKGWLKLAGVGQYVYHWIASWSGMTHQGAWRDPTGDHCPYPDDDHRCMSIFKGGRIGHNHTFFAEWATKVLLEVKTRKMEKEASIRQITNATANNPTSTPRHCSCT